MGTSDPLMLEYRVKSLEKQAERYEASIDRNNDAAVELRQTVALMAQDVKAMRKDLEEEIRNRDKRDIAWEARVKRLTIAWFSVAGSLVAGALVLALTVAGAN